MARTQNSSFAQTNAFAMQYGIVFSIYMIIGFLLLCGSIKIPFFLNIYTFIIILTPVASWWLTRRFRNSVLGGAISFGRAYTFSALIYFYASVLLAAVTYAWLKFVQPGALGQVWNSYINSPAVQQQISTPQFKQQLQAFNITLEQMQNLTQDISDIPPISFAANAIDMNVLVGLLLSIPIALIVKKSPTA